MAVEPGQVRRRRLLLHHRAVLVNEPRQARVVVGVNGCQASAGKLGGDRGLAGGGTPCDLDSAHRCILGQV
jgi:hypothetical protein